MRTEDEAKKLFKNFENEDWNAKRERLEQAIVDNVAELMTDVMGGASKTSFPPEEGCPYRITIEYEEVKGGTYN